MRTAVRVGPKTVGPPANRPGASAARLPQSRADPMPTDQPSWERASRPALVPELTRACRLTAGEALRRPSDRWLRADTSAAPGSSGLRFRRIPREALYKFMKDNGIPTDALESGKRKVPATAPRGFVRPKWQPHVLKRRHDLEFKAR